MYKNILLCLLKRVNRAKCVIFSTEQQSYFFLMAVCVLLSSMSHITGIHLAYCAYAQLALMQFCLYVC